MSTRPQRASRSRFGFLGCLLLLLLLALILAGAGVLFFGGDTAKAATTAGPLVNILAPSSGAQSELNVPLLVQARAEHSSMISRVELYADGALVAVQQSTLPNGSNPLIFMQRWTPPTIGRHILLARTYARNGQKADSGIVYVDVVELLTPSVTLNVDAIPRREGAPLPSLNDLARSSGIPIDRLREANPPLRELDPSRPITPSTPIDIPRSPAPPPVPSPVPPGGAPPAPPPVPMPDSPAAPTGLIATADCANAQLNWTDSPDEEQYFVYRIAPGDSRMNRVATLPANTTSYRDTLPALGTYRYQIAAVRAGREGLSGMSETRTPDGCAPPVPPPPSITRLVVAIQSIETTATFERGVYCYYQIDSVPWDRVPPTDALSAVAGNPRRYSLTTLPGRGRFTLDHVESNPVVIVLDCWGRSTLESRQLNPRFSTDHPRAEWDGTVRELRAPNGSFTVRYCISTRGDGCAPPGPFILPEGLRLPIPFLDFVATLPIPTNLRIRNGIDACDELPTDPERGACFLSILIGGVPHLQWDWNGAPFYTDAGITGYHVIVRADDRVLWERDVSPGTRKFTLARTGDLPCGSRISYTVSAVQGARRTAPSDPIAFDTRPCLRKVELMVTFELFAVGEGADDGDICFLCTDTRMELFGGFGVNGPIVDGWAWLGRISRVPPDPFNPFDVLSFVGASLGDVLRGIFSGCMPHTTCVDAGTYGFDGQLLIRQGDVFGRPGNNTLTLNLREGQTLTVGAAVFDFDLTNGPDAWCLKSMEISQTMVDWVGTRRVNITDDRGETTCNIQVRIEGRPAP